MSSSAERRGGSRTIAARFSASAPARLSGLARHCSPRTGPIWGPNYVSRPRWSVRPIEGSTFWFLANAACHLDQERGVRMAIRTAPTKLGATLTLVGILVSLFGISYLRDGIHGLAGSFASSTGPKFKVEYGYFMIPAVYCPGGRCQRPKAQRLKVQSLGE